MFQQLALDFLQTLVRHSPLEWRARDAWALEEYPYKGAGFLSRGWHQHGG